MKTARVLLLILLAALLPLRTALADAVLCAGHASHDMAAMSVMHGDQGGHDLHDGDEASLQSPSDSFVELPADAGPADGVGDPSTCNTCAVSCSTSPLVLTVPHVPTPVKLTSPHLPSHDARALSHLSDGQERPPRSI